MKSILFTLSMLMSCMFTTAQTDQTELTNQIDLNTLENQFDQIYKKSSSYQTYKVIDKTKFQQLKSNVVDSLKLKNNAIKSKESQVILLNRTIDNLKKENNEIQLKLNQSLKNEDSVSIFGLALKKITYSLILWSLVVLLLIGLIYFIYKFKNSNTLTKKAKKDLEDVENELDTHKKKSLENEQILRRKLQDVINKQRKV